MAEVLDNAGDALDTKFGDDLQATVSHFRDNSKVRSNGIREVSTAAYMTTLKEKGVTKEDLLRVSAATDYANMAAAELAVQDMEEKIGGADKGSLDEEGFRKGLSSVVRLPTHGGATEISIAAETHNNIPFRDGDGADGPQKKISYGRVGMRISTKTRISRDFVAEADARMRKALGVPAIESD